jgi:hypothetical protein
MDNSFDYSTNTISGIFVTGANVLSATSDPYIGAVFHNLDGTNIIYLGKSNVLSGGENGFALQAGELVQWRAEGDLNKMYAVAGGGTNLKLSYVLFK